MAIYHNLSDISNNLSGFDPVEGESDGTSIGKTYLLWQIFKGLESFDSNVIMISGSGLTPSWLANESGSVMTTPAKNSSATFQTVKFFMLNDVGLSGSIPSAFIHEWSTTSDVTSNNNLISVKVLNKISGSSVSSLFASGTIVVNDNGNAGSVANCMVSTVFATPTTSSMAAIPKIIYWRSDSSYMIMAIDKLTAAYKGYLMWHTPYYTGSMKSVDFSQGNNFNCILFNNATTGMTWVESFSREYETSLTVSPTYLSRITSAGLMPSIPFMISGSNTYLTSKVNLCPTNLYTFKAISNELEGIYLTDSTAVTASAGTILLINSKYYITGNTFSDGRTAYKILVRLSS